ncbi:hypothetical protein [Leucobacter coleopterorum]|uniref:hypothetical protein n=1 Tax=Leucobacter coleopterorum TaxID=2714933 RepID=UPI00244DE475|nr:hypothetical protein [Leucobacter coleopterorum]
MRALKAGCDLLCLGAHTSLEQLREIEDHVLEAVASGTLAEARVQEAQERVREFAAAGATLFASATSENAAQREISAIELTRIAESFSGATAARAWISAHPGARVIRVETESNMAVGHVPWGPFAAAEVPLAAAAAAAERFAHRDQFTVDSGSPLPWPVADSNSSGAIVIGRDLHRHAFARDGIDALRAAGVPILTIETGWPASPAGYADIACYGATRLVGSALLSLIEETPV